jgi:hypothetical protein
MIKRTKTTCIYLRSREFSLKDIRLINRLTKKNFAKGRTFISREVCKQLEWKQPNGWLKDRACREVLRALHKKKLIKLPRSKKKRKKDIDESKAKITKARKLKAKSIAEKLAPRDLQMIVLDRIRFSQVKGTRDEGIWNQIVNKYHYLGFKTFVGRSLKYLIYYEDRVISAIGFCDPAWQLSTRDNICKEIGMEESEIRLKGINNGRFLILPWLKIPNLASYILAKAIKHVKADWERYYCVKPIYIETFVDPKRFYGTCYKADNWTLIGKSKGYKKSGAEYSNSQIPKLIFLKLFEKGKINLNEILKAM